MKGLLQSLSEYRKKLLSQGVADARLSSLFQKARQAHQLRKGLLRRMHAADPWAVVFLCCVRVLSCLYRMLPVGMFDWYVSVLPFYR